MFSRRGTYWSFYFCVVIFTSGCSGCFTNWQETFRFDKKQPFDTYALHELLEARPERLSILEDSLAVLKTALTDRSSNYIFVGNYAYYTDQSVTALLDFVERGNTAFIAAYEIPEDLATHLFGSDCYYSFYQDDERMGTLGLDTVRMQLIDPDRGFELMNVYDYEPWQKPTRYINAGLLCDEALDNEIIGTLEGYNANFLRLGWGEGKFYFHANPVFFTNYYLVDSVQFAYAEACLTRTLTSGPVYWDEISHVPPTVARQRDQRRARNQPGGGYNGGRNLLTGNEALSYIQRQGPLALAWYTLILATLLYVVFRGKRRQRIIPIINRRDNSSKRFIDTISRLVYQKGNHHALARQELTSLRVYLQNRFGVRWKDNEPPPENLAGLIGADEEMTAKALIAIRNVQDHTTLSDGDLIGFYRSIEPIYRL